MSVGPGPAQRAGHTLRGWALLGLAAFLLLPWYFPQNLSLWASLPGASHCDFESPTDWMCRLACGDADPARQQRVRQGLLDAAARWLR